MAADADMSRPDPAGPQHPRLAFKRDFAAMFVDQASRKPTCRVAEMVATGKLAAIDRAPFAS